MSTTFSRFFKKIFKIYQNQVLIKMICVHLTVHNLSFQRKESATQKWFSSTKCTYPKNGHCCTPQCGIPTQTSPIRDTLTLLVRLAWNYYPSRTSLFDYWHFKLRQFIGTIWVKLFWDSTPIFKHFDHILITSSPPQK